ncbi:PAS domain-containing sensor histidine kinase [Methanosarcina sp. UBA5]|uniref:PAS domain-containing sensor histidine kinase n=1 Tax=Methanosarcina sp. UBA5 TaxID=1915593 RepID=UPI0025DBDD9B|nr:PAS domain S-box protein [Methanosarcina sp. UBA5]
MEHFPATNPNPVLSVEKDGTVLYSNEASKPLLHEWGAKVGDKLPSSIVDIVQKVITQNNPEKMEVKAGIRIYLIVFHPLPKQGCVNISGFDISKQKEIEGKLRESEKKYRIVANNTFDWEFWLGPDCRFLYMSPSCERFTGYAVWEFMDNPDLLQGIIHPDDRQAFIQHKQDTSPSRHGDIEFRIITKDGEIRWIHHLCQPLYDGKGCYAGNLGSNRDITERKQAEEALRESKARIESIFRSSPVGIGVVVNRIITEANERLCEMTGYSREELLGKSALTLYPTEEEYEHVARVKYSMIEDHGTGYVETHWQRKDGSVFDILLSSSPIVLGDLSGEITFTALDITQRKRAEEALRFSNLYNRSLIEASLDPLVTIGHDGKITDVNCATEEVTGYSRNELIGTDFSDYFTEPEKARIGYQKVFKDGEVRDYPLDIKHKEGNITPVLYHASVYRDEDGKVIGVFAAARDIIERKKAEEALKKAHDTLEEKVKERTVELQEAYNSLKESETGLAEAQKMAHIGNWDWNIATDKAYWSEEMYRIFGRDSQKLAPPYNEFLNYIHPDDRDYVDSALKKATVKEKISSIEYRIVLVSGEERAVHMQSEIIFDEKNTPIRAKGIIQDITESKRAEEKIRILANAVESSSDAIITVSLDGIITSWNKAAEQVYGYSSQEVIGKSVSILAPSHLREESKKLIEIVRHGEKVHQYQTLRLRKDDTIISVSITFSPVFDITGKLVAISGIVRDITERIKAEEALRESESRLRQFYESDMFGVFYFNLDGSVTDANDKLLEIIGYTRADLQEGMINWNKMTPPEYRSLDERSIAELKTFGVKEPKEKEYIRKDGSHVPVIVGIAAFDQVRNEGIAFVLDITEKKKAEEALENIEIARKKEIHHRIKNNLQVISSLLDLQADKFANLKVIEAFRESQNRVISMALIHEELYKGEGTDTLDFSTYIRELAENLFQTYRLSGKNIHLNMNLEENAFFNMDTAVPLGIIVNELISNSLKHAFPGRDKGEIRIKLCREERKGKGEGSKSDSFTLTVSDNGVGIPKDLEIEDLDSLGIQLVITLVDQLDGELELKKDNGTELTIRFTVTEIDNLAQVDLKSQENV